MASESVRRAVRPPITVGWRRTALLGTAALGLLAVYGAVRVTGGAPNPLVHFAYLAIALAAVSAGWRGGLLAGLAAGMLLGPLMPDSTAASVNALGQWGWALRLAAYLLAGGVIGSFWDRSQRLAGLAAQRAADARADAVMRASEERLRRTVEAAADGLLVFDAGGRLTLVNAAAERLLGVPRADLLGATYREVAGHVGIDERNPPAQLAAALAARQPLPPTLVALRQRDGTQRSVEVSGRPLDANGPLGSLVVNLHEVTAERTLARERAAHLEGLQAAAQVAAAAPSASAAGEALLGQVARTWPVVAAAIYLFDGAGTQPLAVWSASEAGGPIPTLVPRISPTSSARWPRRARCAPTSGACRARARARRSSPSAAPAHSSCCRSPMAPPSWAPCWPASAGDPSRSARTRGHTCTESAGLRRASCAGPWRTRRRPASANASGSCRCWRRRRSSCPTTSRSSPWPTARWPATRPLPASA